MASSPTGFVSFPLSGSFHGRRIRAGSRQPLPIHPVVRRNGYAIKAIAAKPIPAADKPQKLSKVEGLKTASNHLRYPLVDELANSEVFITENAVQIMKFHGSYQQRNRDVRDKSYQFMLRLKMPAGDFPPSLYQVLDDISSKYGNQTIRATTRCAWQIHGILKADLKAVFSSIMNAGGSCVGACGDLSRNVMCTPAPFQNEMYEHARHVARFVGELFAPQSSAFSEIWLDGEKAASLEFWKQDLDMNKVQSVMRFDNGNGVVFKGKEEPIYGETYLPRKFKLAVTVPGDNSIDIYTQDIGIVCVPDAHGKVIGYNLIVGGGMGRTHRKAATFARVGDHLGYVTADKLWEALKAIVATQRDHGNRSVRANARMKYLVDKLGIDAFRTLVETYFGDRFEPFRELKPWKYEDWLGWHEMGNGSLFLGLFVENGRIKDDGDFKLRTALRRIIDAYGFDMVVTPNQNIILKNIAPSQKLGIEAVLKEHGVKLADEYHPNRRISMACPALPLCGLATSEAERIMPQVVDRVTALFDKMGVATPVTMRMTGCPNGCARPYMAELGFVGCGANAYQLWLGGSPNQTRLAWTYLEKTRDENIEKELEPILDMFTKKSFDGEAFGDFCNRMGKNELLSYAETLKEETAASIEALKSATSQSAPSAPAPATAAVKVQTPRVTVVEDGSPTAVNSHSTAKSVSSTPVVVATVSDNSVPTTASGSVASKDAETKPVENAKAASAPAGDKKTADEGASTKKKIAKIRPRLTVSDEIMERLKNIAALRDMSASMVADEIIAAYLSGVEDEELMQDL